MIKLVYYLTKIVTVIGIVSCLLLTSCSKSWLDEKVDKAQAVPETVTDFQAMLDNFSSINFTSWLFGEIAADGHYYRDADFTAMAPFNLSFQNAYTWGNKEPYINVFNWQNTYAVIANMNIILDQIGKKPNRNEFNNVRGQALFQRAYQFYSLAQIFAPKYTSESANAALGIPLRLSTDITEKSTRSSLEATYQQILSDLLTAKDILPVNALYLSRGSKLAVIGLLSRVYLSMNDYNNALLYANEYLTIKSALLQYSNLSQTASYIGNNVEIAYLNFYVPYAEITSNYLISQDLLDLYEDGDIRKKVFFNSTPVGTTFKGSYGNTSTDIFSGIATDEIYLIRAECLARKGDLAGAMKDLNDLVRTRWEKNPDGTSKYVNQISSNETEALMNIFEERRKQLILRGLRWTDLRRCNQDARFKRTLTRTVLGQLYTLESGSFQYTFPIPQDIIAINGIQQNFGW